MPVFAGEADENAGAPIFKVLLEGYSNGAEVRQEKQLAF
jgi:hypothetical protein